MFPQNDFGSANAHRRPAWTTTFLTPTIVSNHPFQFLTTRQIVR